MYKMACYFFRNFLPVILCCNSGCKQNANELAGKEKTVIVQRLSFNVEFDSSLNNAQLKIKKDSTGITINASKATDFFIDPDGSYAFSNAPVLLKKIDNTKPFTFTVEMKPEYKAKYDAGMAFIYVDDKHWLKFAFEADEKMNTRIVTVRTNETSDDNNHDIADVEIIFLKMSSDTKAIGFYYSIDGISWNLVRVFKNDFPPNMFLGIGTQSPAGSGNKTIFYGAQLTDEPVKNFRLGK